MGVRNVFSACGQKFNFILRCIFIRNLLLLLVQQKLSKPKEMFLLPDTFGWDCFIVLLTLFDINIK